MLEHFKFLKAHCQGDAEDDDPGAERVAFPAQSRRGEQGRSIPIVDAIFDDLAMAYQKAIKAFYDAGCRYLQFDDTAWAMICCSAGARAVEGARRRSRSTAGDLRARDQQGAGRQARRHGDHHAFLPRQFPLDLDCVRAATSRWPRICSASAISTAISWNTTATAPAASSRCASSPRARRASCSAWSPRRAGGWSRRTTSSAHRRGHQICRARPALPVAAMRLCLDRGRQCAGRGRAMGQAAHDRRTGGGGVGSDLIFRQVVRPRRQLASTKYTRQIAEHCHA